MSYKSSQFNGDGSGGRPFRVSFPIVLASGIVNYLIMHGVVVESAVMNGDSLTLTLTAMGTVATLGLIGVAHWVIGKK